MTRRVFVLAACAALLVGCTEKKAADVVPPPQALNADAIAAYCGMNVLEHPGPKGQILLRSRIDPTWFASVRDTIAFTILPDEPKDIQAIYVSDMGKAESWDKPGAQNWVEARKAFFVIGSKAKSQMSGDEIVPFSERAAAQSFAEREGGQVVAFNDIPRERVLTADGAPPGAEAPATAHQAH